MNSIVADGTYANLVQAQRNDPNNQGFLAGVGTDFLVPPTVPNDSILNGFPSNCCSISNFALNPLASFVLSKYGLNGCNSQYVPLP